MTNKIQRAIIMAAGLGNRMKPVSLDIPKPMISVNGKRMIDTVIDGLLANEIEDIVIVIGYKKECFNSLKIKYPFIEFIENPYYDSCNNISSLYSARNKLDKPCIILDGDQIIYNDKILSPYFDKSGYSGLYTNEYTSEWLMQESNGVVTSCSREGGRKGWQLFSISRWTESDARLLQHFVTNEFEVQKQTNLYWDDIPMFLHFKDFSLSIYEIQKTDVIEIDDYSDLTEIDNSYINYIPLK